MPLGGEFQIHQVEIPKLGSKWILIDHDKSKCPLTCEVLDVGPDMGDGAMRKFVFTAIGTGYSEIVLWHQGEGDGFIESASYGVEVR